MAARFIPGFKRLTNAEITIELARLQDYLQESRIQYYLCQGHMVVAEAGGNTTAITRLYQLPRGSGPGTVAPIGPILGMMDVVLVNRARLYQIIRDLQMELVERDEGTERGGCAGMIYGIQLRLYSLKNHSWALSWENGATSGIQLGKTVIFFDNVK